jgi:hypothetical protein
MSLNINKLEKVVELANGAKQARCPACAEAGQDEKGEHLRIYPEGRFGCCVFAGDREHRKRIFALAGVHERQSIRVNIAPPKMTAAVKSGLLGRLGRVFGSPTKTVAVPVGGVGTLGTGQYPYTRINKNNGIENSSIDIHKEFRTCVPSVPSGDVQLVFETPVPGVPSGVVGLESQIGVPRMEVEVPPITAVDRLPFLTAGGDLSIPFDSPSRYHWWRGGQSVAATMAEISANTAITPG